MNFRFVQLRVLIDQELSNFFAGIPSYEIKKFPCTTNIFFHLRVNSKADNGKLADSGDEIYNVASSAAY